MRILNIISLSLVCLLATACGGGSKTTADTTPPVVTFTVSANTIMEGGELVFTVSATENATPTITCDLGTVAGSSYTAPMVSVDTQVQCTASATDSSSNTGTAVLSLTVTPSNAQTLDIVPNSDVGFEGFDRKIEVFEIPIYAVAAVDALRLTHAANVMAQYLDNNEDGVVDNPLVHSAMKTAKAALVMWKLQSDLSGLPESDAIQDLGNDETNPAWHTNGNTGAFDAALEEVLHLVTHVGYANAYPEIFGERVGSSLANAMDVARGGQFTSIPASYPAGAWYTYDDNTCDYSCMVTEYIYWGLTSKLGAHEGRLSEISQEWTLNTPALVAQTDTGLSALLDDPLYTLPLVLPDGSYQPNTTTPVSAEAVVLTNVTIIDGTNRAPMTDASIVVENGMITRILGEVPAVPAGATVMNLAGHYVIPGLIDGHTHLTDSEDAESPKQNLTSFFTQGITSVRDMAGNGTALKSLQTWSAPVATRAPHVYFSALVAGPNFLAADVRVSSASGNSIAGEVSWMPRLDSSTDIQSLVSEAKAFGVTGLKLYADISPQLAQAVITEAKGQGLQVWAHAAVFSATFQDLLSSGVNAVSHANMLTFAEQAILPAYVDSDTPTSGFVPADPDSVAMRGFFEMMREQGVVLDATLLVTADQLPDGSGFSRRANELGVLVGVGTDVTGTVLLEMKSLIEKSGFTSQQAIIAATANNAKALGIDTTHGTVEVGKVADLVVLSADPLLNIDNMSSIVHVVKGGYVHTL